jgi:hypothetical protein
MGIKNPRGLARVDTLEREEACYEGIHCLLEGSEKPQRIGPASLDFRSPRRSSYLHLLLLASVGTTRTPSARYAQARSGFKIL